MWEAMMMLRLIASASPRLSVSRAGRGLPLAGRGLPLAGRITPPALPVDTLKGAIRLNFAAWRLSLPLSQPPHGHHDRKTA
ncbi:hypothetical protein [Mesorhizobium shangrilense]|uniref:Uncharacterized protein n=1 Tax=Mesorhizobium shangrilense TaxID=460060 RepID=A0ABV2DHU0_9HYPH